MNKQLRNAILVALGALAAGTASAKEGAGRRSLRKIELAASS